MTKKTSIALLILLVSFGASAQEWGTNWLAPEWTITVWYNTPSPIKVGDLKGKVALLDFWGVWCSPCVKAVPKLDKLAEDFKDEPFKIITIHTAKKSENLANDLHTNGYKHVVAVDLKHPDDKFGTYGYTMKAYKVQAFPTYVLIDKKGKVRSFGDFPSEDQIRKLLNE